MSTILSTLCHGRELSLAQLQALHQEVEILIMMILATGVNHTDIDHSAVINAAVNNINVVGTPSNGAGGQSDRSSAKRPLNSFMTFRAYYNGVLGAIPQKHKSSAMRKLWTAAGPYHPTFAVIGKAYSIIRDKVGKNKAPLDKFLALVASNVGVIKPQHVLDAFGFDKVTGPDGTNIVQVRGLNPIRHPVVKAIDCAGILRFCAENGYFDSALLDDMLGSGTLLGSATDVAVHNAAVFTGANNAPIVGGFSNAMVGTGINNNSVATGEINGNATTFDRAGMDAAMQGIIGGLQHPTNFNDETFVFADDGSGVPFTVVSTPESENIGMPEASDMLPSDIFAEMNQAEIGVDFVPDFSIFAEL